MTFSPSETTKFNKCGLGLRSYAERNQLQSKRHAHQGGLTVSAMASLYIALMCAIVSSIAVRNSIVEK
jgi:hypothetical protein